MPNVSAVKAEKEERNWSNKLGDRSSYFLRASSMLERGVAQGDDSLS